MYKALFRPLLFLLSPEQAHQVTSWLLRTICAIPGLKPLLSSIYKVTNPRLERQLLGLRFPNPIGLAAGFDKDAKLIKEWNLWATRTTPDGKSYQTVSRSHYVIDENGKIMDAQAPVKANESAPKALETLGA